MTTTIHTGSLTRNPSGALRVDKGSKHIPVEVSSKRVEESEESIESVAHFEFFLTSQSFDTECLFDFLKSYKGWSIFWYALVVPEKDEAVFFVKLSVTLGKKVKGRIRAIHELLEIFDSMCIIAYGYNNVWNVVVIHEGITHIPRVWLWELKKGTFFSMCLVSLLNHELWLYMFKELFSVMYTKWQLYHWKTIEDIKKYLHGTIKHSHKSYIRLPIREELGSNHFVATDTFPLYIKFSLHVPPPASRIPVLSKRVAKISIR